MGTIEYGVPVIFMARWIESARLGCFHMLLPLLSMVHNSDGPSSHNTLCEQDMTEARVSPSIYDASQSLLAGVVPLNPKAVYTL